MAVSPETGASAAARAPAPPTPAMRQYQAYWRDLWKQASELHGRGVTAEDAARMVDLTMHKADFPSIQGPGVDVRAMLRMYDVMEGRELPQ